MPRLVQVTLACAGCGKKSQLFVSEASADGNAICDACGHTIYELRVLSGYVYVLSNPRMPGLLKIGSTTRSVPERVAELNSATGVPVPFAVEAYFAVASPEEMELSIHQRLSQHRVLGREFFEIGLEEVIRILEATIGTRAAYQQRPSRLPGRWSCGLCKHQWTDGTTPEPVEKCPLCSATSIVRLSNA